MRPYLFIGGALLFMLIAAFFYFTGGRIASTDDAYVHAARVEISANIAGRVTRVYVRDNQRVHLGDPLFELDSRDLRIAMAGARAKLAYEQLQLNALQATYLQRQALARAADATLRYRQKEFQRQKILAAQGISSQAQLEQAQYALADAEQKLAAAREEQSNAEALLGSGTAKQGSANPAVQQAQALLRRADLNLSYALVRAPMDGIVSRSDALQAGDYIQAAAPVFALVSNRKIWIEANFKETELAHMQPGQKATIEIDAYPDRLFHGRVESFSSGTGSSFSLLPPENATGNWVKVVQRLPVRIRIDDLDPKHPLASGLSAIVKVNTGRSRWQEWGL
ncbi:MAG TPA: HlyD family secretion protein [Burkholderiales bacterium]|nr:HlyD family secretion protein [Burkholderiales bacterium]